MNINLLLDARYSASRAGLALLLAALTAGAGFAQTPQAPESAPQGQHLTIVIVEGDGAINNVRQRTAREPIVEVQDENHKPVAGAVVVFTVLPSNGGAGAAFVGDAQTAEFVTDQAGRAAARGFHPNGQAGQLQVRVTATSNGRVGTATISQTNVLRGAASTGSGLSSLKLIAIIGAIAGAAAVGAVLASHGGSHESTGAGGGASGGGGVTSISPGTPTVGAP